MANSSRSSAANYTLAMFNSIRDEVNTFAKYVPTATIQNIQTIKAVLDADPNAYNTYVEHMLKRIGQTIIDTPDFTDPFTRFYKNDNEMSHLTQQVYIEPIHAESAFNPAGPNPLGRRTSTAHVAYYDTNYKVTYAISIDRVQLMDAFATWSKLDDYWGAQMKAMYQGEAMDRYAAECKVINDAIADTTKPITSAYLGNIMAKDDNSGRAFVQGLKYVINDLQFPNTMNIAGVLNTARPEQLVLLLNKDLEANIDVYTLASLFNAELVDIPVRVIKVRSFDNRVPNTAGTVTGTNPNANVLGLLTTPEFFQFRRTMNRTASIDNPQGLFRNHFYHVWASLQIGQFAPAVVLRTGEGS